MKLGSAHSVAQQICPISGRQAVEQWLGHDKEFLRYIARMGGDTRGPAAQPSGSHIAR